MIDDDHLLSHELTHYLQDRERDLGALTGDFITSTDRSVALSCLVEGEAVVNSARVLTWLQGRMPEDVMWPETLQGIESNTFDRIAASNAPLLATTQDLPYWFGTGYVAAVWNGYGHDKVDALFDAPPAALLDFIAGYGNGRVPPTRIEPLHCGPPAAPDGFSLYALDSFGVAGALALLRASNPDNAAVSSDYQLASGLRNDAIAVYAPTGSGNAPVNAVLFAWRLGMSATSETHTLADRLRWRGFGVAEFGKEVVMASSVGQANPFGPDELMACPTLPDLHARLPAHMPWQARRLARWR